MGSKPTVSICIPTYKAPEELLQRCLNSIEIQTFRDFEIVQMEDIEGKGMGWNTNQVIQNAKGKLIKILYQDDYFAHKDALQIIVDNFKDKDNWLVTACTHTNGNPHYPRYNENIHRGINTIGSPSVLTIRNQDPLLFEPQLNWVLDCDYYKRLYQKFGEPKIVNDINVVIGIGPHQTTHRLSEEQKKSEIKYLIDKY